MQDLKYNNERGITHINIDNSQKQVIKYKQMLKIMEMFKVGKQQQVDRNENNIEGSNGRKDINENYSSKRY